MRFSLPCWHCWHYAGKEDRSPVRFNCREQRQINGVVSRCCKCGKERWLPVYYYD